ncbi:hypothetical protein Hanom_Chr09g00800241 [Helianthus anomalus]
MADPHDFVSDLQAYSPSCVFQNNFIDDESPVVYFHQASSSSRIDENMQPEVEFQQSHFQMFSPNEEGFNI